MTINRRFFLGQLSALAVGVTVDPDELHAASPRSTGPWDTTWLNRLATAQHRTTVESDVQGSGTIRWDLAAEVTTPTGPLYLVPGDGIICQFPEPDGAFRAACELQLATVELGSDQSQPLRIKVVTVQPGQNIASLAAAMSGVDKKLELFRVLNEIAPGGNVTPGQKVKIITDRS